MKNKLLFFDMEFTSLSPDAQLISLGIISDCDKCIYCEFSDFDINPCDDWVKENVVSKLQFQDKYCDWYEGADFTDKEGFVFYDEFKTISTKIGIINILKDWLSQFKDYDIQFVADCCTFDWYWMLKLIGEWNNIEPICNSCNSREHLYEVNGYSHYCVDCERPASTINTGLPKLPANISPVPFDLNDLIAIKKGITPRDAFDLNREALISVSDVYDMGNGSKHNSLWDAKVIKEIYNKLI